LAERDTLKPMNLAVRNALNLRLGNRTGYLRGSDA